MSDSVGIKDVRTDEKGEKRGADSAELDEVQSANNWENANLGDDDRRKKFLRLMGASKKKEHHGKFVIGDTGSKRDGRTDEDTSRLQQQLENQYSRSLDLKLSGAARHHSGLGFSKDDKDAAVPSSTQVDKDKPTSDSRQNTDNKASTTDTSDNKPDSTENSKTELSSVSLKATESKDDSNGQQADKTAQPPQKPKFMMNFVKASD